MLDPKLLKKDEDFQKLKQALLRRTREHTFERWKMDRDLETLRWFQGANRKERMRLNELQAEQNKLQNQINRKMALDKKIEALEKSLTEMDWMLWVIYYKNIIAPSLKNKMD